MCIIVFGGEIMVFEAKKKLRQSILKKRDAIDINTKTIWDNQIFSSFINSNHYQNASTIFTFVSFGSEVDTHKIIKFALSDNKIICVPKTSKKNGIEVFRINGFDDLEVGYFKILEPIANCEKISPAKIDFILMPGLAFNRVGDRIGYGGGFYDRFLLNISTSVDKIALAYHFQVVEDIPTTENDIKIDGIITNKEVIHCF